jgi:hypothetical protein
MNWQVSRGGQACGQRVDGRLRSCTLSLIKMAVIGKMLVEDASWERIIKTTFLYSWSPCGRSTLRQSPWLWANDFSLTVGPEVRNHTDDVVKAGVGSLVEEQCAERAKRVDNQACLN